MCGLKQHLLYPDFQDFVTKYDLLFISETKLDIHDSISIPNYTFISKPRKQKAIRKSGGLGVFVKNEILQFVEELTTGSEYVFWIKIAKSYTNDDKYI